MGFTKKVIYKTPEEIELLRKSCLLVCDVLAMIGETLKPGITGNEIDAKAEQLIRDNGAVPGFKGLYGFPGTLCISRNEGIVHGIPTKDEFKDGDIVSIDCGTIMNEFYGDAAYTFAIGDVKPETMRLLSVTKESLRLGIMEAKVNNRIGDISHAIQHFCEKDHDYSIVRELVGHGLGKKLHEPPEVPNYGRRGSGPKIKEGLVIAIEPMVNMGRRDVRQAKDGWTIVTKDKLPSAHFEHSIAVTANGPDILSDHGRVEAAISKNPNLKPVLDVNN